MPIIAGRTPDNGVSDFAAIENSPNRAALLVSVTGEDTVNGVLAVEHRFQHEQVAASAAAQVMGSTGAAGDLLHKIVFFSAVTTGVATITDGTTTYTFPVGWPAGVYEFNAESLSAGWTVDNSANTGAQGLMVIGRFT